MKSFNHFIIEGCDRLGKSSLINHIKNTHGFYQVIHFGKPEKLSCFPEKDAEFLYQIDSFANGFHLLADKTTHLIFDRFTIGEYVYSPRYRKYDGSYIFTQERGYGIDTWDHVCLVLLTTSDWSFIQDDGESFDFSKKEEEQHSFIEAFDKSIFKHKVMIDVNQNGFYKPSRQILNEVMSNS